jgi:hypothetical protein
MIKHWMALLMLGVGATSGGRVFVCQAAKCTAGSDEGWVELKDYVVANPDQG